ncbi:MAG: class III extradiol dioxygenase subunit B-like domain-containing protein, partial [Nocardioidaceae bacterium]
AAAELDALRAACADAVGCLLASDPEVVVCVGDGPEMRRYDESAGGTMHAFGVDTRTAGRSADLPLALTVGEWLLDRAGWDGPRRYIALSLETTSEECVRIGATTAAADLRVGVLALGDGSAKRSEQAPGYLDERAEPFDAEVAAALGRADLRWLSEQPPPLACAELWVAGRQAWQFLAGAATQTPQGDTLAARMHYDAAPYGVGYLVASWVARS